MTANFEDTTRVSGTTNLIDEPIVPTEDRTSNSMPGQEKVISEEFKISGDALVSKVKELIHQSNVRRVIIKNEKGRTLIEMPLNFGVIGSAIGAAVAPEIVALGVIGAMVAHLTLVIERTESEESHNHSHENQPSQ